MSPSRAPAITRMCLGRPTLRGQVKPVRWVGGTAQLSPGKPSPAPVVRRVTYSRATGCGPEGKVRTQGYGIRDYRAGLSRTESSVSERVFLPERAELWDVSPPRPIPGSGLVSFCSYSGSATLSMLGGQAAATICGPGRKASGSWAVAPLCTPLSSVHPAPSHCQGFPNRDSEI